MISDDLINELISCPKQLKGTRLPKLIVKNRSARCDIQCTSSDKKNSFTIFIRKSEIFIEDFSVGLIWTNARDENSTLQNCILLRCQGPHDGKVDLGTDLHHSYHTHTLTSKDVAEHRFTKPSLRQSSDQFSSFEEAIYYFEKRCGIMGLRGILPHNNGEQLSLLD